MPAIWLRKLALWLHLSGEIEMAETGDKGKDGPELRTFGMAVKRLREIAGSNRQTWPPW